MNISKNSWHYKLVDAFGTRSAKQRFDYRCHTTCTYIRSVIWAALMGLVCVAFFAALGAAALTFVASMIAAPIILIAFGFPAAETFSAGVVVFGTIGWVMGAIAGVGWVLAKLGHYAQSKSKTMAEKSQLIRQAYADKKNGVCTLVKLED